LIAVESDIQGNTPALRVKVAVGRLGGLPVHGYVLELEIIEQIDEEAHASIRCSIEAFNRWRISERIPVCATSNTVPTPNRYVIDFKTTIHPKLDPLWLYQVLGYVLLEAERHLGLEGMGFYLVRQGKFVGWTLQSLIPALTGSKSTTIEHLRRGFKGSISIEARQGGRTGEPS
jgi:hypothetical protein